MFPYFVCLFVGTTTTRRSRSKAHELTNGKTSEPPAGLRLYRKSRGQNLLALRKEIHHIRFAEKPDRKIGERLLRPGIEKLAIAFCAHGREWYHVIFGTARPGAGMPQPRGAKAKTRYRFSGTAWIFNSHQLSHRRVAGFPHVNSWGCPSPEGDHPLTRANAMNTLFGLTDTGGCQNSPGQARQIEVFGGLEILIVFGGYVAE